MLHINLDISYIMKSKIHLFKKNISDLAFLKKETSLMIIIICNSIDQFLFEIFVFALLKILQKSYILLYIYIYIFIRNLKIKVRLSLK